VEEIRIFTEKHGHDALLAVLPESRNRAPSLNDTHEQIKKRLAIPSQCIHQDNAIPARFRGEAFAEILRADPKLARGIRNRLDASLGNLLVKAHWFPFVPAAPFHYNAHIGLDVGGRLNNQVMACLGYGFRNPQHRLFFKPAEIPMDVQQGEPVPPEPLLAGLLHLLEEAHSEVKSLGDIPDLSRVLFLRDGQLLGAGEEWNEIDALHQLYQQARQRGWVGADAIWTAVEIMKAAEGWRSRLRCRAARRQPGRFLKSIDRAHS